MGGGEGMRLWFMVYTPVVHITKIRLEHLVVIKFKLLICKIFQNVSTSLNYRTKIFQNFCIVVSIGSGTQ